LAIRNASRGDKPCDIRALCLGVQKALCGTGHAEHVAEGAEITSGRFARATRCRSWRPGYADGATRPVHQRDLMRQQLLESALDDGVGLAAADFHDVHGRETVLWINRVSCAAASASRYSSTNFTAQHPQRRRGLHLAQVTEHAMGFRLIDDVKRKPACTST